MFGALSALSLLGLRYPLKMLPLLFFEMGWKAIWLTRILLPAWMAGPLDAAMADTAFDIGLIVFFPILIPWRYVFATYFAAAGDPWWRTVAAQASQSAA